MIDHHLDDALDVAKAIWLDDDAVLVDGRLTNVPMKPPGLSQFNSRTIPPRWGSWVMRHWVTRSQIAPRTGVVPSFNCCVMSVWIALDPPVRSPRRMALRMESRAYS